MTPAPPLLFCLILTATPTIADTIEWPDPEIQLPREVQSFIRAECLEYAGVSDETLEQCMDREAFGYRAVVMMLTNHKLGERAAQLYRECAAGLGRLGGRFHRRRAECIGTPLKIRWRFGYSQKT